MVIVVVIVHAPDETLEDACNAKRCLAAIAILLSWAGKKCPNVFLKRCPGRGANPGSFLVFVYFLFTLKQYLGPLVYSPPKCLSLDN